MSTFETYKADLDALVERGEPIRLDLSIRHLDSLGDLKERHKDVAEMFRGRFEEDYQRWYTESRAVIKQLVPDRLEEFDQLYKGSGHRKTIEYSTFTIQD